MFQLMCFNPNNWLLQKTTKPSNHQTAKYSYPCSQVSITHQKYKDKNYKIVIKFLYITISHIVLPKNKNKETNSRNPLP